MTRNGLRNTVLALLLVALGVWYAAAQAPAKKETGKKAPAVHARGARPHAPAKQEPPSPPPPPPTPEQQPPVAPQVRYQNGQLTVVAPNSRLGDVLRAISLQTGAQLDLPAGAANQRVVDTLGPGTPQQVVGELLDGSKFDYVIVGSATRPGQIDKILLTPPGSAPAPSAAAGAPPRTPPAAPPQAEAEDTNVPDEGGAPEDNMPPAGPEQPAPEEQAEPPQPEQPQPMLPQPQAQPGQPEQPNPQQPKTPEQLLQELQRMQQQQQQQQTPK